MRSGALGLTIITLTCVITEESLRRLSFLPANDLCQNIYTMVCHKAGETFDPSGYVQPDINGEKQATQMYQKIIHQHRDWTAEEVDEEIGRQIFTPRRRGRIEAAFYWVRHGILRFIDLQPNEYFNVLEKQQIKSRVLKTELQVPPPASVYADEPDLLTGNEAYYERMENGQTRLRVGGAYLLIAKSWFNLIFTFAHELAHSIDPCEIKADQLKFAAYDRLSACFLRRGLIAQPKDRKECGANDQLSETFADWVAVQVTAEALTLFATEFHGTQVTHAARNSVRDLCEQDADRNQIVYKFHPPPKERIELIFGHNPAIRELLDCHTPAEPAYCTFGYAEEDR